MCDEEARPDSVKLVPRPVQDTSPWSHVRRSIAALSMGGAMSVWVLQMHAYPGVCFWGLFFGLVFTAAIVS